MSELTSLLWKFVRAGNAAAEIVLGDDPSEKEGSEGGEASGDEDVSDWDPRDDGEELAGEEVAQMGCTPKTLGIDQALEAAWEAVDENPANALPQYAMAVLPEPLEPLQIAVMTSKYWGPKSRVLSVSFMESTSSTLVNRILSHMNAWSGRRGGGISFKLTNGTGQVRISRATSGYWSYLGTDIKLIPASQPTMSLQAFTMNTPESEYRRVVRHEAGHTLGFPHEHMRKELIARIDPKRAYAFFLSQYGWDKATVDAQVLTPLNNSSLMRTPPDQDSIMCYQLPGSITTDGQPIRGGLDINSTDYFFVAKIYPKPRTPGKSPGGPEAGADDARGRYPVSDDGADAKRPSAKLKSAVDIAREYAAVAPSFAAAGSAAGADGVPDGSAATLPGF